MFFLAFLTYIISDQVTEMLLELCVTELEDVATDSETGRSSAKPVVQESAHPYTDDTSQAGVVRIPGLNNPNLSLRREKKFEYVLYNFS